MFDKRAASFKNLSLNGNSIVVRVADSYAGLSPRYSDMTDIIAYFNELELGVCQRINQLSRLAWVRHFFSLVSRLGDYGFWVMMGAAVFALQGAVSLPALAVLAGTAGIGILVYKWLKKHLLRERPYINDGNILCGTAPLDRYSFPSGHTLHAVSLSIMLVHVEPALAPVVIPFAMLVAVSRVVLGLHYPSDVLAGALIGTALGKLGIALIG